MSRSRWMGAGALVGLALVTTPLVAVTAKDRVPESAPGPVEAGEIEVPSLVAANKLPSLAPLVEAVEPAVVAIEVDSLVENDMSQVPPMFREYFGGEGGRHNEHGEGSGFVISGDGLLLTNNHVIEDATALVARFSDGSKVKLRVLGTDPATDIALCQLEGERDDWAHVDLGSSAGLLVGDWVVAVGNPLGLGLTVTAGIVSGKGRALDHDVFDDFIQTDAAINPGNSGGPLFDLEGRVVGMNTAIVQGANTVGFSIPADLIRGVVSQLRTDGRVSRGYLGVGIQELDPELASAFGAEKGAVVTSVSADTPAGSSGIASGDVITGVGDTPVDDPQDLILAVSQLAPGQKVSIQLVRDGASKKIQVTLGERPGAPDRVGGTSEPQVVEALPPGRLGIVLAAVPDQLAQMLGSDGGAAIQSVAPGSPADGRLRPGDVIVEVDKQPVTDPDGARAALKAGKDTVVLKIIRGGSPQYVAVDKSAPARD